MKKIFCLILYIFISFVLYSPTTSSAEEYRVGVGDILSINILQPDKISTNVTVSPSGQISVPYIGTVQAKGKTINQLMKQIQFKLANGYLKYPVVTVSLLESKSRYFTISGEVSKPGKYPLGDNTTVLKAISIAGGFTKFGSKSKVKILRQQKNKAGYKSIEVDIKAIIDGKTQSDILIKPGDIIVVSESFF